MSRLDQHPLGVVARDWLLEAQESVRSGDYARAGALFVADVLFFGGSVLAGVGREEQERRQWRSFWPQMRDFAFRIEEAHCFGDSNGLCVAALFDFLLTPPGGSAAPATSRVTAMLLPQEGRWLAVHAHWSTPRPRPPQ